MNETEMRDAFYFWQSSPKQENKPVTLTVKIDLENDAFSRDLSGCLEISRLLAVVGTAIERSGIDFIPPTKLADFNGNTVGSFMIGVDLREEACKAILKCDDSGPDYRVTEAQDIARTALGCRSV